jgi:tetratricopeptide (TPR) repeat protein
MRSLGWVWALGAWSWLWAQAPQPSAPVDRALRLMDDADKLAEQRTAKAMEQALVQYREAAPIWHELQDRAQEGKALERIGALSLRMGNFQVALENLSASLPLFQADGDRQEQQGALNNIGLVESRLGHQRRAIEVEEQALRLAQELGNRNEEAVVLNNLGLAYHELGEERQAIAEFEKALAIHHELKNVANEGAAWSNLGAIHYTQGDLAESLDAFERALALRKQGNDRRGEGNTTGKIAVVRHAFGQDEEALQLFQKALAIVSPSSIFRTARIGGNIRSRGTPIVPWIIAADAIFASPGWNTSGERRSVSLAAMPPGTLRFFPGEAWPVRAEIQLAAGDSPEFRAALRGEHHSVEEMGVRAEKEMPHLVGDGRSQNCADGGRLHSRQVQGSRVSFRGPTACWSIRRGSIPS